MSTQKQIAKGKKLLNSLDELESSLDDLLSQDLLDTAVPLSTLQQAKLYALLPYVLNDLIFGESSSDLQRLRILTKS